jgi:hypothetical protein
MWAVGKFKDLVNFCKPILCTLQEGKRVYILEDLKQCCQLFSHSPRSEEDVVRESVIPGGTLVTSQAAAVEEQVWYTSAKN